MSKRSKKSKSLKLFFRNAEAVDQTGCISFQHIFFFALVFGFGCLLSADLAGQKSRKQLEREKRENQRKLEQANAFLKEVKKEKKVSISQLNALKQKARLKERHIIGIQDEIQLISGDIQHLQSEEEQLAETLRKIKKEYAALVYAASKANVRNQLMYLFASQTFHQFFRRLQYLRYYAEARRNQAKQINELSAQLSGQKQKLAEVKQGKEDLLDTEKKEKQQLEVLKSDQDKVVKELSQRESELREKIENHKAALKKLERLISDLVAAEIKKSRNQMGPPPPPSAGERAGEQRMTLTPEGQLISKSFSGNKRKLAWPVQNGFVSTGFGRHEHAVLKRIYVDNLGVDISTRPGEKVRSVFEGVVGLVGQVPGMDGQIVMIRHGDYFTVYSGLKNVRVGTGQKVKLKEIIGEVVKNDDDGAILQFQIWKNSRRLDPEDWLAKD